jgi:hypothetical protein
MEQVTSGFPAQHYVIVGPVDQRVLPASVGGDQVDVVLRCAPLRSKIVGDELPVRRQPAPRHRPVEAFQNARRAVRHGDECQGPRPIQPSQAHQDLACGGPAEDRVGLKPRGRRDHAWHRFVRGFPRLRPRSPARVPLERQGTVPPTDRDIRERPDILARRLVLVHQLLGPGQVTDPRVRVGENPPSVPPPISRPCSIVRTASSNRPRPSKAMPSRACALGPSHPSAMTSRS